MTGKLRLRVRIGSGPDDMQTAWVNVEDKPTEIDSKYWVGRVFVRVHDFHGFTPDGSPPTTHSAYFEGRNRRFHIQAEGRFKKQYNGDEVWFGTQFDHMIKNFPETLFNTGMRVARYIDPAVFYDKNAARPFIMSPFVACVNTLSAWPAPHRAHDAVLTLENGEAPTESDDEHVEDDVPRASMDHHGKTTSKAIRYWSFVGFRESEDSNELEARPVQESLHEERMAQEQQQQQQQQQYSTTGEEPVQERSIRTVSTRYDPENVVVSGNPRHRQALTRLGSYGRDSAGTSTVRSLAAEGRNTNLTTQAEADDEVTPDVTDDELSEDDDNASFHTALEQQWEVHEVVAPDGSIHHVKKKKKGLTVKKVRKSLHIPSAKTVQKNMRSLSIKRKERPEKKEKDKDKDKGKKKTLDTIPMEEAETTTRSRKSLDIMRPFRKALGDKDDHHKSKGGKHETSASSITDASFFSDSTARADSDSTVSKTSTPVPNETAVRRSVDETRRLVIATAAAPRDSIDQTLSEARSPATQALHQPDLAAPIPSGPITTTTLSSPVQPAPVGRTQSAMTTDSGQSNSRTIAQESLRSIETVRPPQQNGTFSPTSESAVTSPTSAGGGNGAARPKSKFPSKEPGHGKEIRADELYDDTESSKAISHRLDEQLGPWRFSNPSMEPIEDTAFIFGDNTHTVKDRRKHFAKSAEVRKLFEFDQDIVYCMSFFLGYVSFDTFDIKFGLLGANLHKYLDDQPVRYMARSAKDENEIFFMVEFQLEPDTTGA